MKRPVVLLVLLAAVGLGACSREASHNAAAAAPQPSAVAQQSAGGASAATSSAVTAQAAAAQAATPAAPETAAEAQDVPGTASLERIAAMPSNEQLPDGRWKAGVNYNVISPSQPTGAKPGKIEVMEVFWLGCPHCYAFEPYVRAWLKKKPSYVEFVRVPVMWGPVHRLHARLFYTLEALGRDDLVERAFDTIHRDNNPLIGDTEEDSLQKQIEWAQSEGISADDFRKAYNSFAVTTSLEHAQEITERFRVEGVPDVIVAGKYACDVGTAGGDAELIQLMGDLAAFEHHRKHST